MWMSVRSTWPLASAIASFTAGTSTGRGAFLKCSWSRSTSRTSACLVTAQNGR
jgi:hypothetical protein